jgi:hypothetical protein
VYIGFALEMPSIFKTFVPVGGSRSRIRLSAGTITALEWGTYAEDFDCLGLFRSQEELLCAPADAKCENGEHPFADVLAIVESASPLTRISALGDIPPARNLIAPERLIRFTASWTTAGHSQLDLNLGVEVTGQLGWSRQPGSTHPIYVGTYGGIIVVMSERGFLTAQQEDLSGALGR